MRPLAYDYFKIEDGDWSIAAPDTFNFAYDVVDRIAAEEPDKRALVWVQDKSSSMYKISAEHEREFSFGEMSRLSNQAANYLSASGIGLGDRVIVMLKRHYSYWYVMLALHKLGAVAMPSVSMLNHDDLLCRMNEARVSAVICLGEDKLCAKLASASADADRAVKIFTVGGTVHTDGVELPRVDTGMAYYPETMTRVQTDKTAPMLVYFTSGTTGMPKMVAQDGLYPLAHISTAMMWQCVRNDGLHLSVADTGWAKASWGKLYGQWLCGTAIMAYDYDIFSAVRMLDVIRRCRVTTFCAPPTIYRFFVKNEMLDDGFGDVEYATTAGEAINSEIVEQFRRKTGLLIHSGYGQTESVLLVGDFNGEPVRMGAMGKPSPLYHPIIVNENGEECADGEQGEIVIPPSEKRCEYGLCMKSAEGYDLRDNVWHGDLYRTGDIATRDADGYYWFSGRVDDMIKSSGYRVSPFEIESVLIRHEAVMECAVTGVPDPERGFVVKATVVLRDGYKPDRAMVNSLRDFVREKTADYKAPRIVEFVQALPKTFSGKIRHVEIRERDAEKK